MIYTDLTKKAMKLCFDAHKNQVDKSGMPYVFHPFHLAEQMTDEATTVVALLHDVVEDTELTFEDLEKQGFSYEIINALKLLTHDKKIPYMEYVGEIKKNKIKMFGRKTRTPPTPAIIPSTIISEIIPAGSMFLTNSPNKAIPFSIHSCGNAPKVNVVSNIIHKNKNRIGNPNHLFVRTMSMAYESSAFLSLFL